MRVYVFSLLGVLLVGLFMFFSEKNQVKISGVSLVSPPRQIESSRLGEISRINADWVAVIPYGFSRIAEPAVSYDHERQWWGEKTAGTCELINFAKKNGLKVMLKPHVWVMGQGWTGDYDLDSEEKWQKWETDFTKYILTHAQIADSLGVELLCIGTEYRTPAKERPDFWRGLVRKIREVYQGQLTYASNWDNFENIDWWDEVDYIGIDSYFPLADGDSPSIAEMKHGWEPIKRNLSKFSEKWDKQILFTEYGFQSVNGGAGKHWEVDKSEENANMEVQSKAYQATFEMIWEEPWFAGGFLWKWHLTNKGPQRNRTRFTPQGKPAEEVIAKWYRKSS